MQRLIQAIEEYQKSQLKPTQPRSKEPKKLFALQAAMKVLQEQGPLKTDALYEHVKRLGVNVTPGSFRVMLSKKTDVFAHNEKREWILISYLEKEEK